MRAATAKKAAEEVPYFSEDDLSIYVADSREKLRDFGDGSFQCCVTSPPYWGLRDYDFPGQIGAEPKVDDYIADLVSVFREMRRTLADDGTFWLNIGDAYTSGGRTWRQRDKKNPARGMDYRPDTPEGLKPKDLIGLPWRLAFALQADGWYLRTDIVWNKPNCQPESVKDRPTRCHEFVFFFTKSEQYIYDTEAIMEHSIGNGGKKNRRTVWNINTEPYKGAHFAVFPPKLVELCVLAGSKKRNIVLDPFLGSGTVGAVSKRLGRGFVGIEMKRDYAKLAVERIRAATPTML
jgi:site-specific DNA-methyltransferase (adenine-specific)/site-specific DNA-methyltransferase (cytosine-N4-specific)